MTTRTHLGPRDYLVAYTLLALENLYLKEYIVTVEEDKDKAVPAESRAACPHCSADYASRKSLLRHLRLCH